MFKRAKGLVQKGAKGARQAMGMPIIAQTAEMIKDLVGAFLGTPEPGSKETFEEAVERKGMSEEDLQREHQGFMRQSILFIIFAIIVLAYAVYLILNTFFMSGVVTFIMAVLLTVLALRAHFWAFQVAQRKLGCSLAEWLEGKINTLPVAAKKREDSKQ